MKKTLNIWVVLSIAGITIFSLFNLFGIKKELLGNQIFFYIVGYIFLFLFFQMGINFFKLNSKLLYLIFIFALFFTFIIGDTIRGTKRWIDFYFFRFQTSEFFRVFFLVYMSNFLSQQKKISQKIILKSFLIFFIPFIIIFKQPDLAGALIYLIVYAGLLFFSGYPFKYFLYSIITLVVTLPLLWNFLKDYQKLRFISFINPDVDPQGIAYNLIQSVITIGSGGFFGRGLGLGTQSRHAFLPEFHTDFAFASLVEQFGLLGGAAVILLYAVIIYHLVRKAVRLRQNRFKYLFLTGCILFITTSLVVNVFMNLGMIPVAGVALPLISYGGSSIVTAMMLLGLALSI